MKIQPDVLLMPGDRLQRLEGLYAITPDTSDSNWLVHRISEAIAGGAAIVQYRNKSASASMREEQARLLAAMCHNAGIPFIVNDDVELARKSGADGVHLGRDDPAIESARRMLGADALIGVSCYGELSRALDAQRGGANYVAFGSFYASETKPGAVRPPLELLRQARAAIDLPIVAIGGITAGNAGTLIEAGADAVAVISALFQTADTRAAARAFAPALALLTTQMK